MHDDDRESATSPDGSGSAADSDFPGARTLWYLTFLALIAGILTGFVGGAFRKLLVETEAVRTDLVEWALGHGPWGPLVPVAVSALAAGLATWIGHRWKMSGGSGIQHVEAVERGQDVPATAGTVPARFVGGLLSIGVAGMVLGREGPTVHMGATLGALVARIGRAARDEIRVLQTCLSGAGLAVAFNAPIGGAIFVFEEVAHKVRIRYLVWTLIAVAAAVTCSRVVLGDHPDFRVLALSEPAVATLPLFAVFGLLLGLLAVGYNYAVTRTLASVQAFSAVPPFGKGAAIGAVIGLGLVYVPEAVSGGDTLAQSMLDGRELAFWTLALYLALRFCTGPLSYSAGSPGGLFAPMLALGTLGGVFFARLAELSGVPIGADTRVTLMIAGMAGLFAASVRAPFTGIVLVMEMCAITTVSISMVVTAAFAVIVAAALRSPPVYDSLREQMLDGERRTGRRADGTPLE